MPKSLISALLGFALFMGSQASATQPFISVPEADMDGSFMVTWPTIPNATAYTLRQQDLAEGRYRTIYNRGTDPFYQINGLSKGTYSYYLLAYCGNSFCPESGQYSDQVEVGNLWLMAQEQNATQLDIAWLDLDGVTEYAVELTSDDTNWVEVYRGQATQFSIDNLDNGLYRVRLVPTCSVMPCDFGFDPQALTSDPVFVNQHRPNRNGYPVANDDWVITSEDSPKTTSVMTNDDFSNAEIDRIRDASFGEAFLSGNAIRYVPDTDFCGFDKVEYRIREEFGSRNWSEYASVHIYVSCENDGPLANEDTFSAILNQPILLDVLANDFDAEGDDIVLTGASVFDYRNGETVAIVDNKVQYTGSNFCENNTKELGFVYYTEDSQGAGGAYNNLQNASTGRATVNLYCSDSAPIANDDSASGHALETIVIDVLSNDGDPQNMALSISGLSQEAVNGTAVVVADKIHYTPVAGSCGPDSFSYQVTDPGGNLSNEASVSVDVACMGALDDTLSFSEGASGSVAILANDQFPNDQTAVFVDLVTHGQSGQASFDAGSLTYAPNDPDFCGQDSLTYRARSADDAWVDEGQVAITVICVNDRPVANADTSATSLNTQVVIDVLANDTDVDGQELQISRVLPETDTRGVMSIVPEGILFTPATGFCGDTSFKYYLTDEESLESYAGVVSIAVCQLPAVEPGSVPASPEVPLVKFDDGLLDVRWSPVSTASHFALERSDDAGATWSLVDSSLISGEYRSLLLRDEHLTFRVSACNQLGCSAPSGASPAVGPGVVDTPQNLTVDLSGSELSLDWQSVPNATHYILQVSVDGGANWASQYQLTESEYARSDVNDAQFVFRVKACDEFNCSGFTPLSTPVGSAYLPDPGAPRIKLTDTGVLISWYDVLGASHYNLMVRDPLGSETMLPDLVSAEYEHISSTLTGFTYSIQACNALICSEYSEFSIPVGVTQLDVPDNVLATAFDGELSVTWDAVTYAEYYQLQLSVDSGVSWTTYDANNTTRSYTRSDIFAGAFQFRVRACVVTLCSAFSPATQSVGVNALGPVEALMVTQVDRTLSLSWSQVADATLYGIQLSSDNGNTWSDHATTSENSFQTAVLQTGTYRVRVKACNAVTCANPSDMSESVEILSWGLQWGSNETTVGVAIDLLGNDVGLIQECRNSIDVSLSGVVENGSIRFFQATSGYLSDWQCKLAATGEWVDFVSPLRIQKLSAPAYLQTQP